MNYDDFEASVCRESNKHDWQFFVDFLIDGEWYPVIHSANPDDLAYCLECHQDIKAKHIKEIVDAYFHACDLNAKKVA